MICREVGTRRINENIYLKEKEKKIGDKKKGQPTHTRSLGTAPRMR